MCNSDYPASRVTSLEAFAIVVSWSTNLEQSGDGFPHRPHELQLALAISSVFYLENHQVMPNDVNQDVLYVGLTRG